MPQRIASQDCLVWQKDLPKPEHDLLQEIQGPTLHSTLTRALGVGSHVRHASDTPGSDRGSGQGEPIALNHRNRGRHHRAWTSVGVVTVLRAHQDCPHRWAGGLFHCIFHGRSNWIHTDGASYLPVLKIFSIFTSTCLIQGARYGNGKHLINVPMENGTYVLRVGLFHFLPSVHELSLTVAVPLLWYHSLSSKFDVNQAINFASIQAPFCRHQKAHSLFYGYLHCCRDNSHHNRNFHVYSCGCVLEHGKETHSKMCCPGPVRKTFSNGSRQ